MRDNPPLLACACLGAVISAGLITQMSAAAPTLTHVDALRVFSPQKRAEVAAGLPVVEVLHEDDDDFAVVGAVVTTATPQRLVTWSREITELQRGRYVPLIERFSDPPTIQDLESLTLDEEDLEDLEDCRPGRCGLKLSAAEIEQVTRAIRSSPPGRWRAAALDTMRSIMVARVRSFQANGFRSAPPYDDEERSVRPAHEFETMLRGFGQDSLFTPRVNRYLEGFPATSGEGESFFYWSKDLLGDAKPVISITHLSILPETPDEPAIVVASQVFATHYLNASASLTAVTECANRRRYLVYVRRSRVDVFQGRFGGFVRRMVNKRVRAEGRPVLDAFRTKLERGLPLRSEPAPVR